MTSEAFQRVTGKPGEPFKDWQKVWHHGRNTKFSQKIKKEQNRTMEDRISFQKQNKKRNVLVSKLRPVKDFKW